MKATVTFTRCVVNSQELGSNAEHMVSRVGFGLAIEGRTFTDLYVVVKQTVGSNFETADLEVGPPQGYTGPFNHIAFRAAVERYYRNCVGSTGMGFRVQGAAHVTLVDCVVALPRVEVFEVEGSAGGW